MTALGADLAALCACLLTTLNAAVAGRKLRCWFYSALSFTQAALAEKGAGPAARLTMAHTLWLKAYFDRRRDRLLFQRWAGLLTWPVCVLLRVFSGARAAAAAALILYILTQAVNLAGIPGLVRGTDGVRHEPFNRYAPLADKDKRAAQAAARGTCVSALGSRFFSAGLPGEEGRLNSLDDGALKQLFSRL